MTTTLVSICRVEGARGPFVRMRLKCATSRVEFAELTLTVEDYGLLATGMSEVVAEGVYSELDKIGAVRTVEKGVITVRASNLVEGFTIDQFMRTFPSSRLALLKKHPEDQFWYEVFRRPSGTTCTIFIREAWVTTMNGEEVAQIPYTEVVYVRAGQ